MPLAKQIRRNRWIGLAVVLTGAVMISFIPLSSAGWFEFHCPHRLLFGFGCPLCGTTRAISSVLHLKLHDALELNPAVYGLFLYGFFELINLLQEGKYENTRRWIISIVILSYLAIYGYRFYCSVIC